MDIANSTVTYSTNPVQDIPNIIMLKIIPHLYNHFLMFQTCVKLKGYVVCFPRLKQAKLFF